MLLLASSSGYSQRIILIDTDTAVCFTKKQAAFLLAQSYRVQEQDQLLEIRDQKLENYRRIMRNDSLNVVDLRRQVTNGLEAQGLLQTQVDIFKGVIERQQRTIRRQKVFKWVLTGTAALGGGYLGYRVGRGL